MTWRELQKLAQARLDRLQAERPKLCGAVDFGPSDEETYEFWRELGFPDPDAAAMAYAFSDDDANCGSPSSSSTLSHI